MRHHVALCAVATLLLSSLGPTPMARAHDAGTADFLGTHDAGGTIRFTADRTNTVISALEIEGLAGGGCSWGTVDLANWGGPIAVVDNTFEVANADGDTLAGRFLQGTFVEGTVEVVDPVKGCRTGPLRWFASVALQ